MHVMGLTLDLSVAHSALLTQQFPSQTQKQHLIAGSSSCLSLKAAHMGNFPLWGLQNLLKAVVLPLYRDIITAESLGNMTKNSESLPMAWNKTWDLPGDPPLYTVPPSHLRRGMPALQDLKEKPITNRRVPAGHTQGTWTSQSILGRSARANCWPLAEQRLIWTWRWWGQSCAQTHWSDVIRGGCTV